MKFSKFFLPAIFAIAIVCASTHSFATVLSSWSFEVNTPPDLLNSTTGPNVTNEGGIFAGVVGGTHASAATDWTTPVGNGSANSYSVNTWAVGDYFSISSSSVGYEDLTLTFDATGSNTGPANFKVQVSTDGSTFSDSGFIYTVLANVPNWNSTTSDPIFTITTSLPASLDNAAAIYLRLVNTTTVAINGGTTATAGTSRIDNVLVEGTAIAPIVPEPTSIALAMVSLGGLLIRRK